ncbi:MAG: beta-galactosidase [Bacillota bacterium]
MYRGVAYYPEHWDESLWQKDFDRMKELGINTIRIGEFMWSLIEPKEGKFDFSLLDKMVKKISQNDFKIMIGIPTATFPIWILENYDNIVARDRSGNIRKYGTRRQYCYNSKDYKRLSKIITKKIVKRYKDNENIIAWQVDNELGHEGSDFCTCKNCNKGFSDFLKDKYKTIDNFNKTSGNVFWGQIYNKFEQVDVPFNDLLDMNPTIRLDYMRFMSKSIEKFNKTLVDVVNEYKSKDQLVTTNLPGGLFDKAFDPNDLAKSIDFVSFDNYPVWGGEMTPPDEARVAMELDMIRGLKNQNFWIVEELIGGQGHDLVGWLPRKNQAKLWAMQANLRGAENIFFFRFRQYIKGEEQFCQGIFDSDNKKNRKFKEVKDFFEDVQNNYSIEKLKNKPKVAIIYDYDSIWSFQVQKQSPDFEFSKEILKLYRPLFNYGVNCDIIDSKKNFDKYDIIILPNMQILDDKMISKLDDFSNKDKTIIFSYRSGIRNKNNNLKFENSIIEKYIGSKIIGYEALSPKIDYKIKNNEKSYNISLWRDILEIKTAKSLYTYEKSFEDYSCVTKNKFNKSDIYYFGSSLPNDLLNEIYKDILSKHNVRTYEKSEGLEIINLKGKNDKKFILNHSNQEIVYNNKAIQKYQYTNY